MPDHKPALPALFLDDERFPPADGRLWAIVRTVPAAIAWVEEHGFPSYVSFDNDLGEPLEGYDLAKWLCERDLDTGSMPDDFAFQAHSMNVVREQGIRNRMNSHLALREATRLAGGTWGPGRPADRWACFSALIGPDIP